MILSVTARKPSESVLQYYKRLKENVADGTLDLEKSEIYAFLFGENVSADHARKALRTLDMAIEAEDCVPAETPDESAPEETPNKTDEAPNKTTLEINKEGWHTSSKLIRMRDEDTKDAEYLLKAHGYCAEFWELISARSNIWNAYSKQDGIMELYSSKITVKPKSVGWSIEDIDRYFENKVFANTRTFTEPTNYDSSGEILEIDLPDLHAGLFSWRKETMEDYDIHIAKAHLMQCLGDIIVRCNNRKFSKIVFATLGDMLHVDNDNQTTARGTLQQLDGRIPKVFDITLDMLIEAVEMPVCCFYRKFFYRRLLCV